jgi:hypothetical protein
MQEKVFRCGVCLLPMAALVTSCASYTFHPVAGVADVYVSTSPWSAPQSLITFRAGPDGSLTQVQTLPHDKPEFPVASNGMFMFTANAGTIHEYTIGEDGTLTGPVSSLHPSEYDPTRCGAPLSGKGMFDPSGTYLTVELWSLDCDIWQTYRVQNDGTYQFLGQDDSNAWLSRNGEVYMGGGAMSSDGQFAYASGEIEGFSFLAGMKRDTSGVLRILPRFDWPWDRQYRYQPGNPVTDGQNHMAVLMMGNTNENWNQTWLATFRIDPSSGNLQAVTTYDDMPKIAGSQGHGIAFSPQEDTLVVSADGSLQTFLLHDDGPATPGATMQLPGQYFLQMAWDRSHHLYVLTQTIANPPAIEQFSLYVFTVTGSQFKPAPGSPWNAPNGYSLMVVPRS